MKKRPRLDPFSLQFLEARGRGSGVLFLHQATCSTHDGIEPFPDHLHHAVGGIQVELDLGYCRMNSPSTGSTTHWTEQRQADAQAATRRGRRLRQFQFRRLDLGQDAPPALEEVPAFGRLG
jgi:hypothetical protein